MIDLTEWRFVKRDKMRSKTVGDWDCDKKEIVAWSGLDEITMLEVWAHELNEMILCTLAGVDDKLLLKYDKAHDFACSVSDKIVEAAGLNVNEHNQKLLTYEGQVLIDEIG